MTVCCARKKRTRLTGDLYADLYSSDSDDSDDEKEVPLLNDALLDPEDTPEGYRSLTTKRIPEDKYCSVLEQALIRDGYGASELTDENMIRRYYRASKGDMDRAFNALKNTINWRQDNDVDDFKDLFTENSNYSEMEDIIRFENESGKAYVRGYDREGRATLLLHPSKENSKNGENCLKHLVYSLERAVACSRRRSLGTIDTINIIICFDGYSMSNAPSIGITRDTINTLQNHYPERLNACYLVNTPGVFGVLWSLAKPFIDSVTRSKIYFIRGESAKEALSEAYDLHHIEDICGGYARRKFDTHEYLRHPFYTAFAEMDSTSGNAPRGNETNLESDLYFDAYSKHSMGGSLKSGIV